MTKLVRLIGSVLRSSIMWGSLASVGFYALIHTGTLHGEFFQRYFAAHWTLYAETTLFFIGIAELLLKTFDFSEQRGRVKKSLLEPRGETQLVVADAPALIAKLDTLPYSQQSNYLPRRLREAIDGIIRQGSAEKIEDDLKYLSEVDAGRAHAGYAMLRIIIWAIPILGFLGTVIGITIAIASLNPQALESSLGEVTGGLGIAFDTTALALTLSMILMFGQFLIDRVEQALLSEVDARAFEELTGRFESVAVTRDPHLAAVQRMSEMVLLRVEGLVQKQVELWQGGIEASNQRWVEVMSSAETQLERGLAGALNRNVKEHADRMVAAETNASELKERQWLKLHKRLKMSVDQAVEQKTELGRQTDILLRIVDASNQVAKLEKTLNHNLATLSGAQHFQEMLLNLSATLTLLNARLGQVVPTPHIELHDSAGRDSGRESGKRVIGRGEPLDKNAGKVA